MFKTLPANAGDEGLIPGLGRFPGGGNGNPLQYSCVENSMDRGAWRVTVHGVTKSQTRLGNQVHQIHKHLNALTHLNLPRGNFSGDPVVKTLPSSAKGTSSITGGGAKIAHAFWPKHKA